MQNEQTTFAIHVDCDPLWVYESELGLPLSDNQELIYTQALPAMLEVFSRWNIRATFFVIGRELAGPTSIDFCRAALAQGHRLANHSFSHPINFAYLSPAAKREEITAADLAIRGATGENPIGFRAPGYCADKDFLPVLQDAGYLYDSSVLPGPTGALVKAYMTLKGRGNNEKSYGPWSSLFARQRAHQVWLDHARPIWRYPVATFPGLRLPIHSTFAFLLGETYLSTALELLRRTPGHHVYLLHAIDSLEHPISAINRHAIPLRFPLQQRLRLLKRLGELVQGHVALTEDLTLAPLEKSAYSPTHDTRAAAAGPPPR